MIITDINGTVQLNNNVQMPYLGLGVYKTADGKEVTQAIHNAFDIGYRHVDTASFYKNEEGVGEAIKTSNIDRKDVFLTTKVWIEDMGTEKTRKAFETSLNKLQTDYIDLYLIHWPVPSLLVDTWKAMEGLYQEGKIKAIGVCNCLEHQIVEIMSQSEIKPMVLQNEFHPKLVQPNMLSFCKDHNIQMEAWSPLMRGRVLENETIVDIAQKHKKSTAQVILRWDLQKGIITIPKSTHKERIAQNADIFDFELSNEDIERIDSLDTEERTGAHPDHFMEHFGIKL
ncbi:MAG: aldo/keto reductase [Pseudopedobacter saltans]|uniref:Aldo/keto reductase n=1 Tax=Pseudopedobacter saltans TaxID=151895 RepID=A0A2W5GUC1_9SPHI|nr:MAG: aldo/keto reductase [Pseudopedobacter saltans]